MCSLRKAELSEAVLSMLAYWSLDQVKRHGDWPVLHLRMVAMFPLWGCTEADRQDRRRQGVGAMGWHQQCRCPLSLRVQAWAANLAGPA